MPDSVSDLVKAVQGPVLEAGQPGYDEEVAGFNAAIEQRPALVVGARSTTDVVEAVRFARARRWRVAVQATGHGAEMAMDGGLLITTRRLDSVSVDAAAARVRAGAGVRWGAVVAAGAPHALAPVAGSSPTVGVVGFLLGGGIGPLVRSHGFGSDHLQRATLVTGTGEVVTASTDENPELLWALRGGRPAVGVVTEVVVQLVALPALYAGTLFFAEAELEAALRAWVAWTAGAPERVFTGAAVVRFPPVEALPPPLRGRRLLALRFSFPGERQEGERLAAPLRAAAPVYLDMLGPLPIADVARIYNDPTGPLPAWASGGLLARIDQDFATALLREVGPQSPFLAVEVRHLGGAAARDVPGGSAVGGRGAGFTFGVVGADPASFASILPQAERQLVRAIAPWLSPEWNGTFTAHPAVRDARTATVPAAVQSRLEALARRHDPDGLFR